MWVTMEFNAMSQVFLCGEEKTACGYCGQEEYRCFGICLLLLSGVVPFAQLMYMLYLGALALKLTVDDYQALCDRNWRRFAIILPSPYIFSLHVSKMKMQWSGTMLVHLVWFPAFSLTLISHVESRSGCFLYKPVLESACCPSYTIRYFLLTCLHLRSLSFFPIFWIHLDNEEFLNYWFFFRLDIHQFQLRKSQKKALRVVRSQLGELGVSFGNPFTSRE